MTSPLVFSTPTALEYFAVLVAEDCGMALLEAAISVAQDEYPDLDPQSVLCEIDALAARLKQRLAVDAPHLQRLRLLNHFFFHELGFAGNVNNYYDPHNSYINDVLQLRRGLPITLALVYIEMASQLGLNANGVSFPGHFLMKLQMPRGEVFIDPFSGHSLSPDELTERLKPFRLQQGLVGDFDVPLGPFLQVASPRDVLARLLRNLKALHHHAQDWQRALAVQQRLVVLLSQAWEETRDRGLVRARLRQWSEAANDLALYLQHRADAGDTQIMRQCLQDCLGHSGDTRH